MVDRDVYYQVILDGLSRYTEDPFLSDVTRAIVRYPEADFYIALNKNQLASKKWLVDELYRAHGANLGTVYILGGWYGVLAAMLFHDHRFDIERIVSFDIDPACAPIADCVNQTQLERSRFKAVTADIGQIDYGRPSTSFVGGNGAGGGPDIVINTICEHIEPRENWSEGIPEGAVQVLQSNDNFDCEEHVNCVADLSALEEQAGMSELRFAGELPRKRYTRFMLIGRK